MECSILPMRLGLGTSEVLLLAHCAPISPALQCCAWAPCTHLQLDNCCSAAAASAGWYQLSWSYLKFSSAPNFFLWHTLSCEQCLCLLWITHLEASRAQVMALAQTRLHMDCMRTFAHKWRAAFAWMGMPQYAAAQTIVTPCALRLLWQLVRWSRPASACFAGHVWLWLARCPGRCGHFSGRRGYQHACVMPDLIPDGHGIRSCE